MRIVMAGSSGFLGSALRTKLIADEHDVVQLVRRPPTRDGETFWDPHAGDLEPDVISGADAVVNLAGAGVEDKRWSQAYRQTLITSRVRPTATLAAVISGLPAGARPRTLLNGSAVGFYGDTGDSEVDEESPPGAGFFPDLCRAWESATTPAADAGVRVVLLRSGLVLDAKGGLLRPLAIATRLFAGGPMAGGKHWMPWISLVDWVDAAMFLLSRDDVTGPVNLVGPDPVRNAEFARALGRALHRPAPWPIPRFALRVVLGEFAGETVASQRVLPGVLNRAGYVFQHPSLDAALRSALHISP
jgi:uncharacterized protein (TIGR01777 family)